MSAPAPLPHEFSDPALLELALTHASCGPENNERLEFLGDIVLDLVIAEHLYSTRPESHEGDLTQLKAGLVSRRALAEVGHSLALGERSITGAGLRSSTSSRSILANLYEAVVAAVYLDAGLEAARVFVLETLADAIANLGEGAAPRRQNPKQALQQWAQSGGGDRPEYLVLEERGRDHAKAFLMAARVGARQFPGAWGRSRREAERWAAHEAMLALHP